MAYVKTLSYLIRYVVGYLIGRSLFSTVFKGAPEELSSAERCAETWSEMNKFSLDEIISSTGSNFDDVLDWYGSKAVVHAMASGLHGSWRKGSYSSGGMEYYDYFEWLWDRDWNVERLREQNRSNVLALYSSKLEKVYPSDYGAVVHSGYDEVRPDIGYGVPPYGVISEMPYGERPKVVSPSYVPPVSVGSVWNLPPTVEPVFSQSDIDLLASQVQSYWAVGNYSKAFELANKGVELGYWGIAEVQSMRELYAEITAESPVVPSAQDLYMEEYYRRKLEELTADEEDVDLPISMSTPDWLLLPQFKWILQKAESGNGDLVWFENAVENQFNSGLIDETSYISAVKWFRALQSAVPEDEGIDEADVETLVESYFKDLYGDYEDVETYEWI